MNLAKLLIFFGIALVFAGIILYFGQRIGISFGKLPGDLEWKKEGGSFRFPITTCLILSALLTLLLNLFFWIFRK